MIWPSEEPSADQARLAAVFRGVAADGTDADRVRLLREALAVAEGMVGCSITETDGSRYYTPHFAGEAARALDQLQYQNGDGPCMQAVRRQQQCLVDKRGALLWAQPGWAQATAQYGVGCVLSIPLSGLARLTAMNYYASGPASFRPASALARAALLGRAAAGLIAPPSSMPGHATGPADPMAVAGRDLLARARAAVAQKEGITDRQAFSVLVRRSALESRSIFDTARDILAEPGRQRGDGRA